MLVKKQEVSELNRIHVETLKILTTPTKAYNLRSRLVPLSSPEHLNGNDGDGDNIWAEQPPSEMAEMALTEELRHVQEQASRVQTQLNEEELKNSKLMQQIAKLEEQMDIISKESHHKDEMLAVEKINKNKDQLAFEESINSLQKNLQSEQQAAEVLKSEICDLRLILQSSDKELSSVRKQLKDRQTEHQQEMSQLSSSLISTQLQLDKVQLEWEQLLEQHRTLQDSFDQLHAESKFDSDQARQQLQDRQQEIDQLKAEVLVTNKQKGQNYFVVSFRELIETVEQNTQLRKQVSDLTVTNHQQLSKLADLEQNLSTANERMKNLEQKTEKDKDVLLDLMNQIRDLRSELSQKEEAFSHVSGDVQDITAKYNTACLERENLREQNCKMQTEICDLKERLERSVASNKIEVEILQDEMTYATEEVDRLTKVLGEQDGLLQASQEQVAEKELIIKSLKQKVQQQQEAVEKTIRNGVFKPAEMTVTPKSLPRTPATPGSFSRDLSQMLESQERELESRRSSMITMEVLLAELNAERSAKNEEIIRLKEELASKETVQMEIQGLLDKFYTKQEQMNSINGNDSCEKLNEAISQSLLKELDEERAEKSKIKQKLYDTQKRLQAQESMLAQSQTCVQELTNEVKNRCLELREMSLRIHDEEKLLQENEVLRKQNIQLSEENGKLVGHKNHKQRIEYLVKLKKDNTRLQEENEKLRTEISLMRDNTEDPQLEMILGSSRNLS
ncbi:Kinesin-like protein KIF15 [Oryzias melastigma]|uniref:Kinesin-like protein KIF15 n=1 Tax=Oryzias melastigma TaxID=30732 RepID=A0A834FC35_ORYME|nr:Kinesin-like protein KIF15 [Oryzias melastigma]